MYMHTRNVEYMLLVLAKVTCGTWNMCSLPPFLKASPAMEQQLLCNLYTQPHKEMIQHRLQGNCCWISIGCHLLNLALSQDSMAGCPG